MNLSSHPENKTSSIIYFNLIKVNFFFRQVKKVVEHKREEKRGCTKSEKIAAIAMLRTVSSSSSASDVVAIDVSLVMEERLQNLTKPENVRT